MQNVHYWAPEGLSIREAANKKKIHHHSEENISCMCPDGELELFSLTTQRKTHCDIFRLQTLYVHLATYIQSCTLTQQDIKIPKLEFTYLQNIVLNNPRNPPS